MLLLCCDYENIELRDCELSVIDRNGRAESAAQEQLPGLHFRASRDDAWSHWHTRLKRTLNNVAKKQGAAAAAVATALRKGYQETAFIFFFCLFLLIFCSQFQIENFRLVLGYNVLCRSRLRAVFVAVYGNWSAHTKVNVRLGSAAQSKKYSAQ